MHVHTSEVVISQCNSIANNEKPPPPQFDETIPGRVSSFWTHQQGLSRHDQKPKSHICNNMKNLVSIYYKFLRTHHTRSACYHFGTGICNRLILNFSYYCKYGILVFDHDGTGPADESKRTKRVQGWSRQIVGGGFSLFAILLHCEITTSLV